MIKLLRIRESKWTNKKPRNIAHIDEKNALRRHVRLGVDGFSEGKSDLKNLAVFYKPIYYDAISIYSVRTIHTARTHKTQSKTCPLHGFFFFCVAFILYFHLVIAFRCHVCGVASSHDCTRSWRSPHRVRCRIVLVVYTIYTFMRTARLLIHINLAAPTHSARTKTWLSIYINILVALRTTQQLNSIRKIASIDNSPAETAKQNTLRVERRVRSARSVSKVHEIRDATAAAVLDGGANGPRRTIIPISLDSLYAICVKSGEGE